MSLTLIQEIAVATLHHFCRDPASVPARELPGEYSFDAALATLRRVDPAFPKRIRGAKVVDFGCGHGRQSAAFLQLGAAQVLCLEISADRLRDTRELCTRLGVTDRAEYSSEIRPEMKHRYDLVVSEDAMEHYPEPAKVLQAMHSLLKPGGQALITFGPPWYAPYGAHHRFYCMLPWAHLLFGERVMMAARSAYRADGCIRYEDVDGGLNQMSLRKFEALLENSDFRIRERRYEAIKKLPLLSRIPLIRELFVNHVTVWLEAV